MLTSLLIANRGEIARRIIRTARRLGVRTVAVYSQADAGAPHVREADEAVLIGPAPARESYLVGDKILAAALATGAEAIHPGYGFLSENAEFAEAVIAAGLIWVGPPPAAIRAMGLKDAAKTLMSKAGVPVTPGYLGEDQAPERLQKEADAIGYPVLIKAVAGGGGKGMRKVDAAGDFAAALASCQREAAASFGEDRVLIEKYITRPRHIEVQVFGDSHGNVVHLYERDCSLQRRHQKVIEEAPAPGMDAATRAAVTDAAVKAAKAVNYEGAGTIEFIADASQGLKPDRIWFMEMNTRLQVEHPVTETVTGQDLVEWQLRVASGETLPLKQDEITLTGWAMEARLYAENPATGFLPSTGPLTHFQLPHDLVRVDSAVEEGGEVSPFYDPMIAKLIARGETRTEAAAALAEACRSVEVWPVKTNAGFLARCAAHPDFVSAAIDTGFIERHLEDLVGKISPSNRTVAAAAATQGVMADEAVWDDLKASQSPWRDGLYAFRMNAKASTPGALHSDGKAFKFALVGGPNDLSLPRHSWFAVEAGGEVFQANGSADYVYLDHAPAKAIAADAGLFVGFEDGNAFEFRRLPASVAGGGESDGSILSPMPGKVLSVSVKAGDVVKKGQTLFVLEAMKMEHAMAAPFDGTVAEITAVAGAQVSEGVTLARLEASA